MLSHFHTQRKETPLTLSIQGGDEELLSILVEKKANINALCDVSSLKSEYNFI